MERIRNLQKEYILLGSLAIWAILSRILFKAKYLYDWDSVQYTLALDKFDMSIHQPHPPGYPLYVALAKMLNHFIHSGINSYFITGILYSVLAIVLLFLLGTEFSGQKKIGLITALLFLFNYTFWQYGEFPNSYIPDVLSVSLFAYLSLRYLNNRKNHKYLYAASFCLGLVGGFRENTSVFLLPVLIFALVYARADKKRFFFTIMLYAIGIGLWLIPLVCLTGGIVKYVNLTFVQAFFCASKTSIIIGAKAKELMANLGMMSLWLFTGLNILLLPILWHFLKLLKLEGVKSFITKKNIFLLTWIAPPALFYILFHLSKPGYLFTFLPAVYLIAAISLMKFSGSFLRLTRNGSKIFVSMLIVMYCLLSFLYFYNAGFRGIRENDNFVRTLVTRVAEYNPAETIVVMPQVGSLKSLQQDAMIGMWRQVMYYLPDYKVYRLGVQNNLCGDNVSYKRCFQVLSGKEIRIENKTQNILLLIDSEEFSKQRFPGYAKVVSLPLEKKIIIFKDIESLKIGVYNLKTQDRI